MSLWISPFSTFQMNGIIHVLHSFRMWYVSAVHNSEIMVWTLGLFPSLDHCK